MRLNFSNADSDAIREGIKRIGKVVREQIALYGTVTGERRKEEKGGRSASGSTGGPRDERPAVKNAEIIELPKRRSESRGAKGG
jgi:2-aminoadipate transaminase